MILGCAATSGEIFFCGVMATPTAEEGGDETSPELPRERTEAPEEKSRLAYLPPAASQMPSSAPFSFESEGAGFAGGGGGIHRLESW